ncbi:MAG: hypothetical protein AAF399_14785 [Bacteroidota bacterium]
MIRAKRVILLLGAYLLAGTSLLAQNFFVAPEKPFEVLAQSQLTTTEGNLLTIETTSRHPVRETDISLQLTDKSGQVIWNKILGGDGWDYGYGLSSTQDGGFILIGATSSFGAGNNDLFLLKTDAQGNVQWQQTYGGFYNEYGYAVKEVAGGGFLLQGKQQYCKEHNDWGNCYDTRWQLRVDAAGELMWERSLGKLTE